MDSKTFFPIAVLLIIVSFLVGTLWTRIRYLEREVVKASPSPQPQQQAQAPAQPQILGAEDFAKITAGGAAVKGKEDAPVVMVEFSEYLCPFCAEYVGFDSIPARPIDQEKTYQKIMDNYVKTGKVRYIFRDFPLHGPEAQEKAVAARCAGEQGKYWEYHDLLFEKQGQEIEEGKLRQALVGYAVLLGLDKEKFNACLESGKYTKTVEDDYNLGLEIARVAWDAGLIDRNRVPQREQASLGTPTFFINGRQIVGAQSYEVFAKIIEEELNK